MQAISIISITRDGAGEPKAWHHYTCGHCGAVTLGHIVAYADNRKWLVCMNCGEGTYLDLSGNYYPGQRFGPKIEGLPDKISAAYEEAVQSYSVSAFTGVELICRKILMHIAVEKGAEVGKSFVDYINSLEKIGYITPPMKEWVDKIREHGNISAHELEKPEKERAECTLEFTIQLLRIIYEMKSKGDRFTKGKK